MRAFKLIILIFAVCVLIAIGMEYGLRAFKSYRFDGIIHLSSASINNVSDPDLGWISPKNLSYLKKDACYGEGKVSYNDIGFRAAPAEQLAHSRLVCILGDSIEQAYQLPDGTFLASLLESRLRSIDDAFRVLPLAVGGYGTLQQQIAYKKYCHADNVELVVLHWNSNDPINNNYEAERYFFPSENNIRPRPYKEGKEYTFRSPYPISLFGLEEKSLLLKLFNFVILKSTRDTSDIGRERVLAEGYAVAEKILEEFHQELGSKFILLAQRDADKILKFAQGRGITTAEYDSFPENEVCLPRDSHPNQAGHLRILNALWTSVAPLLGAKAQK